MAQEWGYSKENGPDAWHKGFPIAKEGKRQSPIDLCHEKAVMDKSLNETPLQWRYQSDICASVTNTGASWLVNVASNESCLKGGALKGEYELWQFHAHWGSCDSKGSEHTVNGKTYAMELHLVHWNRSKFESPNEAVNEGDGIAVLGIFFQVGKHHEEFEKLCKYLKQIQYKGAKVQIQDSIDPGNFIPKDDQSFWTYEGSLTTPPLLESVIWTVFKQPVEISKEQLETMRNMCCTPEMTPTDAHVKLVDNYRPPVPLGGRTLRQI